jgi:hypothetical protein
MKSQKTIEKKKGLKLSLTPPTASWTPSAASLIKKFELIFVFLY